MKYDEPKAGEWVRPKRNSYSMMCCDCGLVHIVDFRLQGKKRKYIQFRMWRNEPATRAARR